VILGALTCLVVYWLVKEITRSHSIAMFACILLAFDPVSIAESSYGILDPGMTFFYMASILFFYRYMERGGSWNFYSNAILFGLSVASKYSAFILIFIMVGMLLWKKRLLVELKSMALFMWIALIVFVVVQPHLWSSPLVDLHNSWISSRNHLIYGHLVKIPGNPFLIPSVQVFGNPWPHLGPNPIASKPDFWGDLSQATQSPWWYVLYVQVMYFTPFQLLVYPYALYKIIERIFFDAAPLI